MLYLLTVLFALTSAVLGETAAYFLLYRTDDYTFQKRRLNAAVDKYLKQSQSLSGAKGEQTRKRMEDNIRELQRDMQMSKFKSMMVTSVGFVLFVTTLNNHFYGQVAALLPFEPPSFTTGLTHRGLEGEDYREASFIFLYVLSTMAFRVNLQKVLDRGLSRDATTVTTKLGSFAWPQQQ